MLRNPAADAEAYDLAARAAGRGNRATRKAAEDELALTAFHLGRPAETVQRCERLLDDPALPDAERLRIEANRDCALPIVGHALLGHDDGLIRRLARRGGRRRGDPDHHQLQTPRRVHRDGALLSQRLHLSRWSIDSCASTTAPARRTAHGCRRWSRSSSSSGNRASRGATPAA